MPSLPGALLVFSICPILSPSSDLTELQELRSHPQSLYGELQRACAIPHVAVGAFRGAEPRAPPMVGRQLPRVTPFFFSLVAEGEVLTFYFLLWPE